MKTELIIIFIVIMIVVVGTVVVTTFEKIQCEDKGGTWTRMIDGGCAMNPEECRAMGGNPIRCLENHSMFHGSLQCTPGCQFR